MLRLLLLTLIFVVAVDASSQDSNERLSLMSLASGHVRIAEASQDATMLWGRVGGSAAERASARLLADQLRRFVPKVTIESFEFSAPRPVRWELRIDGGASLESAMPAPFDARFPTETTGVAIHQIRDEEDWLKVRGKWAFLWAEMNGSPGRTNVRSENLYKRAVESGAAGFVFSIPTPPGFWQAVVPVDKPFTKRDEFYPDHVRPIPSFCISSDDGAAMREVIARGDALSLSIEYAPDEPLQALNVFGRLEGDPDRVVLFAAHLDAFFYGANDDASGLAVLVGLAHELVKMNESERHAEFLFVGLSGHHDEGAGIRAFVDADPERMARVDEFILLEHLDAQPGDEGDSAGWPERLNDLRAAYVGPEGWAEVEAVLGDLVRETGLMGVDPRVVHDCIADLFVVCGDVQPFTLIQGPPFYHTNHDTLDKISEEGLQRAVEFHMRLLETIGAIDNR